MVFSLGKKQMIEYNCKLQKTFKLKKINAKLTLLRIKQLKTYKKFRPTFSI